MGLDYLYSNDIVYAKLDKEKRNVLIDNILFLLSAFFHVLTVHNHFSFSPFCEF